MPFHNLLSRADEPTLEALIGAPAVRLAALLDRELARGTRLRELLVDVRPPTDLLSDPSSRAVLLDLLREEEAVELCELLGLGQGDDVFGSLRTARFRKRSNAFLVMLGFFGLTLPEVEARPTVDATTTSVPAYALFAHQRRAVNRVEEALSTGNRRVVLHMPTGSGKTRTAMHVIANHLVRHEPGLVVWLAYSEELCEQAAAEFNTAWAALGNRPVTLYRFWGSHEPELRHAADGVLVAGLGKTYSRGLQDLQFIARLSESTSLVVIDEAHQAIAQTYGLVLDTLHARNAGTALLGLTATPGRTWNDRDADKELAKFFDRKKVMLEVDGYRNPVDYLVDEGYLARLKVEKLTHRGGLDLSPRDLQEVAAALDIPKALLESLAKDEQRNLVIVKSAEELATRHRRLIIFATTVEHAHLIASVLNARKNLAARAVVGETEVGQREAAIRWFKADTPDPRALCNFGVLTTGFDAPMTSAVLIARPTRSLVLYSQMVGRAIRGPKQGGNYEAEAVTVVDTQLTGFGTVADAFVNWEDSYE
ncbi:MAG: DEAD/DEAH box helicase family protein [Polyangiaceae bacterium]|nr:DEAD/DEAH box helicase family protein [Polyangiaceae bacterium]